MIITELTRIGHRHAQLNLADTTGAYERQYTVKRYWNGTWCVNNNGERIMERRTLKGAVLASRDLLERDISFEQTMLGVAA